MENYIKGTCVCQEHYTTKVSRFVAMPRIGEEVQCFKNGSETSLKIKRIIHCNATKDPYIIIYL